MKKRLCALTLSLLLLLSALPLTAGAADLPFSDVPEESDYAYAVQYVYENNLMNGVGNGLFAPDRTFTRAMFVTILGRMEGINADLYNGTPFTDVSAKDKSISWAAPYIQWASECGIVNGVGNGKFDPNGIITKEQYCTIILRYFTIMGIDTDGTAPASVWLSDGDKISSYAEGGVRTLVGLGLIELADYGNRVFSPQHPMTRGEIAMTFAQVHNFLTNGDLPGFYGPQRYGVYDWSDLALAIRDSVQHEWDWYVDCCFTDKNDTIRDDRDFLYEKVIAPGVSSLFDLTALTYDYFSPDATETIQSCKDFAEQDGALYISQTDGIGGFIVDSCAIDATQVSDTEYSITLIEYSGDVTVGTTTVTLYLAENNAWVFSDSLPMDLQYVDMAFG